MRTYLRAAALLLALIALFYWKLILVRQFSLLLGFEGANQMYAWFQFLISTVSKGTWPAWDPFTFSGHPFAGEMQTGAFYPLYLFFLLTPYAGGAFSASVYHAFYVLTHVLGALTMFALCRELKLSFFGSIVSGLCFSLAGVLLHLKEWPHLLGSGIWLPLALLWVLRALRTDSVPMSVAWSVLAGLTIGLSVLAGGLHFVIMNGLALAGVIISHFSLAGWSRSTAFRALTIVSIFAAFALAGGAVQLLPSAEYASHALRFTGAGATPASQRLPYQSIGDNISPQAAVALVFGLPSGTLASGEFLNPYLGMFPVILALIGIWGNWNNPWVRYLSGLALIGYLYAMGPYTWLNGLAYAMVPYIWMARESNRFMFLTDFALAALAGFGCDYIFRHPTSDPVVKVEWGLRWLAGASALALVWPTVTGKDEANVWVGLSLILIIFSWALLRYLMKPSRSVSWGRFILVALILSDLYAFDWSAGSINEARAKGQDEMERLKSCAGAVAFLKSRPGPFRVQVAADPTPNVGDFYGIETTWGAGVTVDTDYNRIRGRQDLLNVRYVIRPASAAEPSPVYTDPHWKVYESSNSFPRAWVVHQTRVVRNAEKLADQVNLPQTDLRTVALMSAPLSEALGPSAPSPNERVDFSEPRQDQVEAAVHADSRALVVFSEMYYPGWQATVNSRPSQIWKVDGDLRAVVVPPGDSRIVMRFRPPTVFWGAAISFSAFVGGVLFSVYILFWRPRGRTSELTARPDR